MSKSLIPVQALLTRDEDTPEFQQHIQEYCDSLHPSNEDEQTLVRTMAIARWRMRNAWITEKEVLEARMAQQRAEAGPGYRKYTSETCIALAMVAELREGTIDRIQRWENRQRRIMDRAFAALRELRAGRN